MSPVLLLLAAAHELLDSGKDEISDICRNQKSMEPRCLFVDVFKSTKNWNLVEKHLQKVEES